MVGIKILKKKKHKVSVKKHLGAQWFLSYKKQNTYVFVLIRLTIIKQYRDHKTL